MQVIFFFLQYVPEFIYVFFFFLEKNSVMTKGYNNKSLQYDRIVI